MRRLDEILKSSGWNAATEKGSGDSTPVGAAPDAVTAEEDACPLCGGAGFVRRAVRLGHPNFGRAFPCECTLHEQEDERLARLQRFSNLGSLLRLTFDNLTPRGRSPNPNDQERFAQALAAAREFAEEPRGWLVFSGPSGCGKTHLVAAVANQRIEAGSPALFMVVPDLLDHLRAAYRPDSDIAYDDLSEQLRETPLLVLDDLGAQSSTPWASEKLFQLINHRYNARLPTIFTTNLEMTAFDMRLQTRLSDPSLSSVFSLESSGIGYRELDALNLPLLRSMTFKNFDPRDLSLESEELKLIQDAYREAMKFAAEPRDWLVLAGASGRGKTRLAAAIGNYCRQAGTNVVMVVVSDLLDRLRASYGPDARGSFDDIFDQVKNIPLLILDDLGSQSGTPWADEKLFQLVNYRYNARLPTVITTSLTAEQIKSIDARLNSRLTDPQVSSLFFLGTFHFYGTGETSTRPPPGPRSRGRPRRA